MNVWTKYMLAIVMVIGSTGALAEELIHDSDYYILEAQHKEQWIAADKTVDAKLEAFREKNGGKSPNILYILIDDIGFGDLILPAFSIEVLRPLHSLFIEILFQLDSVRVQADPDDLQSAIVLFLV